MPTPNSNSNATQRSQSFRLTTPLGADVLLFRRMLGREAISEMFNYEIEALSARDADVDFKKLLGQPATVLFDSDPAARYINGIITKCGYLDQDKSFKRYRLTLRPKLWLLTMNASSRIFQQLSIPDILKQVLSEIEFSLELTRQYDPVTYCVQYRETDFNFASRLMEQEGICYYFTHKNGQHTMVLNDNTAANAENISYSVSYARAVNENRADGIINEWNTAQAVSLKTIELWDAHFELPKMHLDALKNASGAGVTSGRIYDFPGGYAKSFDSVAPGGGDASSNLQKVFGLNTIYAGIRLEEANARSEEMVGCGGVRPLSAGAIIQVAGHPQASVQGVAYLLLSCEFTVSESYYVSGNRTDSTFKVDITAIPAKTQYRPARTTRKPVVPGAQTAFVVGPPGQEIFVDKFGRVKVQFNWDQIGKSDNNSSCWLRVAQIWAGQGWGAMAIPRIGHEVIVDFLEGDPDQPIITGRVYNATNMPPYTLPDNMTMTTIKSRSSLGGTSDNFNEIRFEDKKGSEEIFVQAEKDFNRVVENNDTLAVGSSKAADGSRTTTIYKDETLTVSTGNRATTISKGNETITISKGNRTTTISEGNETITISKGNRDSTIEGNDTLTINTGNRAATIAQGNDTLAINTGNRSATIAQGNDSLTISQGNLTVKLDLGSVSIEAMQGITLKVGQSSIQIAPSGITLQAAQISVTGQAQVSVSAPQTTLSGSALMTISGGMVQIN